MSEDNIIKFKNKPESKEQETIQERIANCHVTRHEEGKCECVYCVYYKNAARMVMEFLSGDLLNFENNNKNIQICTHDLKEVFFEAVLQLNEMEKEDKEE